MKSIIKCPYYYFDKAIPDEMLNMIIALGESKDVRDEARYDNVRMAPQ